VKVSLSSQWTKIPCLAILLLPAGLAHSQVVAGIYLGDAHTASSSLSIQVPATTTNLLITPVSYATNAFEAPLYYGYHAGYFWKRFRHDIGFEGEFTHLKVFAETNKQAQITGVLHGLPINENAPLDTTVQYFNITHGVNLLTGNLVARKCFHQTGTQPRLILSTRVGGGITIPHPENEILGIPNMQHYQIGSPVWQLGADSEIRFWRRLYFDTGFRFTRTRESVDIAGGTGTSLLSSFHLLFGFTWHL
jgi:hypothetical protein